MTLVCDLREFLAIRFVGKGGWPVADVEGGVPVEDLHFACAELWKMIRQVAGCSASSIEADSFSSPFAGSSKAVRNNREFRDPKVREFQG